jgi:hypothetical protein
MARKIILIWILVQVVFFGSLQLFDHASVDIGPVIYNGLNLLLFILSVFLTVHESQTRTKLLFLNFSLFFGLSMYYYLSPFIGHALFTHSRFAYFFSFQYIRSGLFTLLLAQSLGFICLDALFNGARPYRTYMISFCAVATVWLYLFLPFITDPLYVYNTPDAKDWKALDEEIRNPSLDHVLDAEELSKTIQLRHHEGSSDGLPLDSQQNIQRIMELYPYLWGNNYNALFTRPLKMLIVKMSLLSAFVALVYIIHRRWTNHRHSGYVMKWIVILMLVLCVVQALLSWASRWSDFSGWYDLLGLLFSVVEKVDLAALAMVFAIRFRFIRNSRNASPLQMEENSTRSRTENGSNPTLQFEEAGIRLESI